MRKEVPLFGTSWTYICARMCRQPGQCNSDHGQCMKGTFGELNPQRDSIPDGLTTSSRNTSPGTSLAAVIWRPRGRRYKGINEEADMMMLNIAIGIALAVLLLGVISFALKMIIIWWLNKR